MTIAPNIPAGFEYGQAYEYALDVDITPNASTPTYQRVRVPSDIAPTVTPVMTAVPSYDDEGSDNSRRTSENWALSFTVWALHSTVTGKFMPEVESLEAATKPDADGALSIRRVRWFHAPKSGVANPNEAYEGPATVVRTRGNTAAGGDAEKFSYDLTGNGRRTQILNPHSSTAAEPAILFVSPEQGAVTGDLITLTGSAFGAATDVTIDGTTVEFTAVGGSTIVFVLPAGTAGDFPIVVTNSVGASDSFTYTRGA